MTMAARPQSVVVRASGGVTLNAGARPVIERLAQAPLTGVAHVHKERALATAFRHWRRARIGPQRKIVAVGQGAGCFREHRGGHHSSDAWQGPENLNVTM